MSEIEKGAPPSPLKKEKEWPTLGRLVDAAFEEPGVWVSVEIPEGEWSKAITGVLGRMVAERISQRESRGRRMYLRVWSQG